MINLQFPMFNHQFLQTHAVGEFRFHTQLRRSERITRLPQKYDIFKVNLPTAAKVLEDKQLTPKNFKDTLKIPKWQKAINDKFKALIDNETWSLVPPNPM